MLKRTGFQLQAKADGQRHRKDHHVATVPVYAGQHVHTGSRDHAEHDDHTATQHVDRNGRNNRADFRDQAADDQEDRADGDNVAAHDACHRNQADVLAEGCVRQTAEDTGHSRAQTVRIGRACDFLVRRFAASAAFADTRYVTDRFDGRDDRHKAHADDDRAVELDPPFEGHRRGEHGGTANVAKVHLTHHQRNHVTCNQADQNGRDRHQALGEELQRQSDDNHGKCGDPHRQRTVLGLADQRHTTGSVLDADLDQRQTDHQNDQAGDQRRQGKADAPHKGADEKVEDTANGDAGHQACQSGHALASDRWDHDRQEGKGRPLNNRQTCAHRAHADGLEQRGDTGKQHRHLDHVDHVRKIRAVRPKAEARRTGNDNRGRHVRGKHRQNVLDAQRDGLAKWWRIVRIGQLCRRAQPR